MGRKNIKTAHDKSFKEGSKGQIMFQMDYLTKTERGIQALVGTTKIECGNMTLPSKVNGTENLLTILTKRYLKGMN